MDSHRPTQYPLPMVITIRRAVAPVALGLALVSLSACMPALEGGGATRPTPPPEAATGAPATPADEGASPAASGGADEATRPDEATAPASQAASDKEPQQTYAQGWEVICMAEKLADLPEGLSARQREQRVIRWIVANLRNKRARYWFINLSKIEKKDRRASFEAEAAEAGFSTCPSASLLFPSPDAPPPAP